MFLHSHASCIACIFIIAGFTALNFILLWLCHLICISRRFYCWAISFNVAGFTALYIVVAGFTAGLRMLVCRYFIAGKFDVTRLWYSCGALFQASHDQVLLRRSIISDICIRIPNLLHWGNILTNPLPFPGDLILSWFLFLCFFCFAQ